MDRSYLPEGTRIDTSENRAALASVAALRDAMEKGTVLEARAVLCDAQHDLFVELPCAQGYIPRTEGALGVQEGITRDIALISRVSKSVCFTVTAIEPLADGGWRACLSRRAAQERCAREYIRTLRTGDIIPARVTRLESFGAFCDVGCGLPALLPIASPHCASLRPPVGGDGYPGGRVFDRGWAHLPVST